VIGSVIERLRSWKPCFCSAAGSPASVSRLCSSGSCTEGAMA